MTSTPAVRLHGVRKSFGPITAVDGLDLTVERGQILALLGPNGAGKTTTVEMCEGFVHPDEGTIEVLGHDPVTQSDAVRARIGVMLQGGGAYPSARAAEMLNLIASYSANPLDTGWLLDTLGLADSATTPYRRLSGGQQQRLALACALVGRPELVFLDEPTAGLDAHARLVVWDLIASLRRDGVAVLLTTHMLDEAESLADELVIIDHGKTVAAGTPEQLTSQDAVNELRFTARPGLELTTLMNHLGDGYSAAETAVGSYRVSGPIDPSTVAAVTAWCAKVGVLAKNLRVEQRSLEDVFLDLTGREIRS